MKIYSTLAFVISVILAFVSYYATSNYYVGGGVLLFSLIFYLFFIHKGLKEHLVLCNKIHECYLFINNFLVSLSIKESLNAGFEATNNAISEEYKEFMDSIDDLNPQEKLLYLNKYFPFHIFKLFTDVILLWLEEGGKILDMSSYVTNEMRQIEEYVTYCQSVNKRKSVELGILWLFSLVIVIALRIALMDFYDGLANQPVFMISVIVLMIVVLLSVFLLFTKVKKLEVRGLNYGK